MTKKEILANLSVSLKFYLFIIFIVHQRITDHLTLLKSKKPIYDDPTEAEGTLHPKYNYTDILNDIGMYKYKVI